MPAASIAAACALATGLATPPAELRFAEMFVMPVGPAGLEATPRLGALAGRRVRVAGYMVRRPEMPPGSFTIAPIPISLGDEDDDRADDLPPTAIAVHLSTHTATARFVPGVVRVEGVLCLGPAAEADGRISSVRLWLDEAGSAAFLSFPAPARGLP